MNDKPLIMFALKDPKGNIYAPSVSSSERIAWSSGPHLPSVLTKKGWVLVPVEVREVSS